MPVPMSQAREIGARAVSVRGINVETPVTRAYLTVLLSVALPAQAMTFQTRMEDVRWQVEGDQFACRLS